MNRLMQSAAILPLLAFGATAQDPATQLDIAKKHLAEVQSQMVKATMVGAVKGPVVKGMPYSADEITETNHVLADGTRIHKETKTAVYRDSEGRTRRETPDSVTITDPVAGFTYVVDSKGNTVRKLKMAAASYVRRDGVSVGGMANGSNPSTFDITVNGDGPPRIVVDGKQLDPKQVEEMIAKGKAEGHIAVTGTGPNMIYLQDAPMAGVAFNAKRAPGKGESLGKKNVEGVIADGTRNVETIETGEIGNDRPIQIVNEHWYSEELGMTVMSKRGDPRTGDETFRLTNIRRGDPAPYLFQPPADSHIGEKRM
jgi:hypothetical protein